MADTLQGSRDSVPPSRPSLTYTLEVGAVVADKYKLIEALGQGGMAAVWRAHNELLDVDVAIKFIRADLAHPGLTSRLLQEARATARIEHPAIVRVSDFGKTRVGDPYIVMELLRGKDLGEVLRANGPGPAIQTVQTLLPIANGLVVAHSKGIVHRDLKPDNVFLAEKDGGKVQPKLVDFGIAKLEKPDEARLTQVGAAMGSPAYMSPEQARGKDVDARADIWSYSVMLYEALCGKLPFDGGTQAALVCAILETDPVPLTEMNIGDAALWAVVERGLRKDPELRWQTMQEMGGALARWLMAKDAKADIAGNPLVSTWSEFAEPAQSIRVGAKEFSDADAEGRTAVATQLSFQNKAARGRASERARKSNRSLLLAGLGFAAVVLVTVPVLYVALSRRAASDVEPDVVSVAASTPATATATAPREQPPAVATAKPAASLPTPPASASAEPEEPRLPKAVAAKRPPRVSKKKPRPRPTAKPKPAAKPEPNAPPPPKPQPGELDLKTTL